MERPDSPVSMPGAGLVLDFFVASDHGLEVGRSCVSQTGQLNVHDDEAAEHDEQQHMDGVDDAHATQRLNDR